MFAILINEKGGEQKRLDFDKPEVTIGRVAGNDIVLPKGNVSKRHSRIVLKDGKYIIVDLKSTNGTYVNGRKITSPLVVKSTDKIYIGDFILSIEEAAGAAQSAGAGAQAAEEAPPPPVAAGPRPAPPPPPRPTRTSLPSPPAALRNEPSGDVAAGRSDGDGDSDSDAPVAAAAPEAETPPRPVTRPPGPSLQPRPAPAAPPRAEPPSRPPTPAADLAREGAPHRAAPESGPPRTTTPPSSLGGLDRPVVAQDRISEKATVMATEAPRTTTPPAAERATERPSERQSDRPAERPAREPLREPASLGGSSPPAAAQAPTITAPPLSRPAAPARPTVAQAPVTQRPAPRPSAGPRGTLSQAPTDDPQRRRHVDLLNQIISKAADGLGLHAPSAEQLADTSLAPRVENAVGDIVDKMTPLPIGFEAEGLTKEAIAEIVGAGPVDDLLADDTVHEIAVTSHDRIYVDRGNGQTLSERVFSSPAGVLRAINRLAGRAGSRIEGSISEMRLDDKGGGALLQVSLPPNARVPSLILRRARKAGGRLQDLVNQGVLSAGMSEFLELCMRERRNFVVSGYGRGVMMGALGGATGAGARVVTVEPVSELDLTGTAAAWIGLIARGSDARSVINHAVRLHPDHLMITDVRGPEALDVAAALCGGQGVVVGVDAASARDAISRLESLGRLSGESPPRKALREELAQGIHVAVHVGRTASGAYRVMEISEVTLAEEGGVEMLQIFSFRPEGGDGQFVSTGHVPAFAG